MPGVSIGPEERKMGIKGSSTCPLILDNVNVPKENLLWEVGKGHLIAFNILNIGRFKLAAGCLGACKEALALSAEYANMRRQFGRPISSFPLIRRKLAEMNIRTYVLESMVYRTAGLMDRKLSALPSASGIEYAKAIAEYALECSINKVFGSEALDYIADEGVQIHGGYGYIQEYKIERIYRDSRINRIFEGTNEINRLLIPGTLMKRALKGELPLLAKLQALQAELLGYVPTHTISANSELQEETHLLDMAKKIFLMIGGLAVQKYQAELEQEQELLADLADMMISIYASESALMRTKKLRDRLISPGDAHLPSIMTKSFVHDSFTQIEQTARRCLTQLASGDTLRTQLSILKKLTRRSPVNETQLKRTIAEQVVQLARYAL